MNNGEDIGGYWWILLGTLVDIGEYWWISMCILVRILVDIGEHIGEDL